MLPLNPFRLVRRMMAPVVEPSEESPNEFTARGPDEDAAAPGDLDPT